MESTSISDVRRMCQCGAFRAYVQGGKVFLEDTATGQVVPLNGESGPANTERRAVPHREDRRGSRVERMFGARDTWKSADPDADQGPYRGFLIVQCEECGAIKAFCAKHNHAADSWVQLDKNFRQAGCAGQHGAELARQSCGTAGRGAGRSADGGRVGRAGHARAYIICAGKNPVKNANAPAGFFACKNLSFGEGNTAGKLAEKVFWSKDFTRRAEPFPLIGKSCRKNNLRIGGMRRESGAGF